MRRRLRRRARRRTVTACAIRAPPPCQRQRALSQKPCDNAKRARARKHARTIPLALRRVLQLVAVPVAEPKADTNAGRWPQAITAIVFERRAVEVAVVCGHRFGDARAVALGQAKHAVPAGAIHKVVAAWQDGEEVAAVGCSGHTGRHRGHLRAGRRRVSKYSEDRHACREHGRALHACTPSAHRRCPLFRARGALHLPRINRAPRLVPERASHCALRTRSVARCPPCPTRPIPPRTHASSLFPCLSPPRALGGRGPARRASALNPHAPHPPVRRAPVHALPQETKGHISHLP